MIRHIVKMIVCFAVSYALVVLVRTVLIGSTIDTSELIDSLFTLRMPYTSSWYFKIQILFYILLAISNHYFKNSCHVTTILVLLYALFAAIVGLPDYWWKTSLCFAVGCCVAANRNIMASLADKKWFNILLVIASFISYVYIRKDSHYILPTQLIAFACIALSAVVLWSKFGWKNRLLEQIGKVSLPLYLIHIGLVDVIYALPLNITYKTIIFIATVAISTVIAYVLSEHINIYLKKLELKDKI